MEIRSDERVETFSDAVLAEIEECTCITFCDEDRVTACSLSGIPHVHAAAQGPGFGPCPAHPGRRGDH